LGLLRGLEFTFLKNLRFLKNVGNDKLPRERDLGFDVSAQPNGEGRLSSYVAEI